MDIEKLTYKEFAFHAFLVMVIMLIGVLFAMLGGIIPCAISQLLIYTTLKTSPENIYKRYFLNFMLLIIALAVSGFTIGTSYEIQL
jgi:hypothetical protein